MKPGRREGEAKLRSEQRPPWGWPGGEQKSRSCARTCLRRGFRQCWLRPMPTKLILFCVYFGPLPPWFHLFLLSCEHNPAVDFVLVTDQDPGTLPANVRLERESFEGFRDRLGKRLGLRLSWQDPFKVADLRPSLGCLYTDRLEGYSHWGYIDCDVIFGRIHQFYDAAVLAHDIISPKNWLLAGHFAVFRNCPEILTLFSAIRDWRSIFENPEYQFFEEIHMTQLIYGGIDHRELKQAAESRMTLRLNGKPFRSLYRNQYPTFLTPQLWRDGSFRMPGHWEWRDGVLTAPFLDNAEMLYLHFTHWCSGRWTKNKRAVWADLPHIVDPSLEIRPRAFAISARGFTPLDS